MRGRRTDNLEHVTCGGVSGGVLGGDNLIKCREKSRNGSESESPITKSFDFYDCKAPSNTSTMFNRY